ncbi:MAG: DEAD/DEAH box helicase family protein [Thermodesulfovibrionales bacterium]|nr:DEAD/DEAH box helicase family protein [Thermodesulfovibrionales bacterium]
MEILTESDTKAKLIDPALHKKGWTENLIRREETERGIDIVDGKPRRRERGRIDYLLRVEINITTQPVTVALIEAKRSNEPADKGLEQAKKYARLNHVPFVYSSNGHLFVEYDHFTGKTVGPNPLEEFPTPEILRKRYEQGVGFSLESEVAKPLLVSYPGGEASRRYYQDAAVRAAIEKIAKGDKRLLLFLATGSGKTFIAVHILKKIADAGQLRRALFVCDRDELRTQGLGAFQNVFGADVAEVTLSNPQKNARILIATYQTLNVAGETEDAKFFLENYPHNYFSHIIIDECHRSAWGKWSIVLRQNPDAVQIGLTATPRSFEGGTQEERREDEEITANNLKYFGEPVYEYDMAQGIEDGYLPACEVIRRATDLDEKGVDSEDIERLGAIDAITGQPLMVAEAREHYGAPSFEDIIQLPDRVKTWCKDLFESLLQIGGPHQKTVIFCVRDTHADAVAAGMNNLYAEWCTKNGHKRLDPYAFKCTAIVGGSQYIADLRGSERSHFVATTVDLITTGVDVPILRNVVFFKYVRSPISFQQMMGRGSRIHLPTNKLMFRVYDYTNATRLLGKEFIVRPAPPPRSPKPPTPPEKIVRVEGFDVHVNPAGTYIVTEKEGRLAMVTVEEYKQRIAERLVEEIKTFDDFRNCWINPQERKRLIDSLPEGGRGIRLLREILSRKEYDLYDVLAEIGFGVAPKSRKEREEALRYKHDAWLKSLPKKAADTLLALARQFERGGTEELENPYVFNAPDVIKAGGLEALKILGEPRDIINKTKEKLFSA